ncbi:MAG: hypothetical protein LBI42_03685 [Chitinispirillales bacterium]|jgi:hypothetical protein|nr:hypothetical protein [Chitinispirillales bacterium]
MENLRDVIADYSNEQLLDEYYKRRGDYIEEAQKVLEEEIIRRNIDIKAAEADLLKQAAKTTGVPAPGAKVSREEFTPLERVFSKIDVLTANAVLRDSKVPYYIEENDEPKQSDGFEESFKIFVYKNAFTQAVELIEEHFSAGPESMYILRQSDIIDRLKSFNFYDITFSDAAAQEKLDVSFSDEENKTLITLAQALLDEAGNVEEERQRVVFFYDSLEQLIEKLKGRGGFTRTDFLAILELCQIYCEDKRYDPVLNQTVSAILSFFLE